MAVLIIGGGIAGLTTALSLHQIGIECRVFESVDTIEPLGVGINTLPHAVRELFELGLHDKLAATAIPTAELAYYSAHGQRIWSEPRGEAAGYRWPQFSIHRGELQMILLEAVRARLGADSIVTGHQLTGWRETPTGVRAAFIHRRTGEKRDDAEGSLLIGADGIHSTVRSVFYPNEGPPIWNGAIMWRGVATAPPFLNGRTMIMAGHESQKFVAYPISRGAMDAGHSVINWIAERKFAKDHDWRREDWSRPGKLREFLPAFEAWRFDWLDVPSVIRGAPRCFEYPMVDRDPVERWSFGRVTLLGDAAHAMYPIGSNGASQAILDARVLAREIQTHGPAPEALLAYEAERRPATARIVLANRRNGPEQVMQLVQERAPEGFARIEDVLTADELEESAAAYKRIAGFDKDALNARAPIVTPSRR
jgi:2-polyprenyl-6-methoxyphenol hydroxylase-like FAD-dependent oxidoreductase